MGGSGSGRKLDAPKITSSYLCIDINHLKKQCALAAGCKFTLVFEAKNAQVAGEAENTLVWFSYSIQRAGVTHEQLYRVPLSFTSTQFKGERVWFICPTNDCGQRVSKLYIGHRLGCRHCLKLSHQSKNENYMDRMTRRANKIRTRLGWQEGLLYPEGSRPKGMQVHTFERLLNRYRELRTIAILAIPNEFSALKHLRLK